MGCDSRDFSFWEREAQAALLEGQLTAASAGRMAQADRKGWREFVSEVRRGIKGLRFGGLANRKAEVERAHAKRWAAIAAEGRRMREARDRKKQIHGRA